MHLFFCFFKCIYAPIYVYVYVGVFWLAFVSCLTSFLLVPRRVTHNSKEAIQNF